MDRLTNDTRPEIPVLTDDRNEFLIRLFTRTVCVDVDRQRLCDANGIRKLDEYSTSKPGSDQRLGYYIRQSLQLKSERRNLPIHRAV
jgi:hypothetical protein